LEFVVFKNAYRYFINSTDFVNLSEIIINSDQNGAFNLIIHDKPYSIKNFVTDIENILKIKGIYEEVEKGSYFEVESNIKFILENNFIDLEKLDAKKYICHSLRLII
jgi:hypothetical protein